MKRLKVKTNKNYDIVIESSFDGLLNELSALFSENRSIFVITDKNVGAIYVDKLLKELRCGYDRVFAYYVEAGENSKNIETLSLVYRFLLENGADRQSVLLALGGGVIGDLAGFAAATYMRGISCVQIPTTLLAQVDSSVGGKTAVDFLGYKNIIGAFYQPSLVYINTETLGTLPKREFSGGMAEVIKYGIIADEVFYRSLIDNVNRLRDPDFLTDMVSRCVELKAGIVETDENETGIREILNYGHTVGHAIEALKDFEHTHGECVALGTLAAMEISRKRGRLLVSHINDYKRLLSCLKLPTAVSGLSSDRVYDAIMKDKKMKSGNISFILLNEIGSAYSCADVERREISEAVKSITREV